ncbi:hypothetical protein TNCV_1413271 [Trichonephila clavipes]|nr:hypothetical protein TNCV_1413271 [Trichonephila clavipes]
MWEQSLHFSSGSQTMREVTSLGMAPMRYRVPTDLQQDPITSFAVRIRDFLLLKKDCGAIPVISSGTLNRVPLRMDFTEINSRGKRGVLLGRIDRQNSRFRTAKTIIKFVLHASFVELESAKNAVNEPVCRPGKGPGLSPLAPALLREGSFRLMGSGNLHTSLDFFPSSLKHVVFLLIHHTDMSGLSWTVLLLHFSLQVIEGLSHNFEPANRRV